MKLLTRGAAIAAALILSACATHQDVLLANSSSPEIAATPADVSSNAVDARAVMVEGPLNVRIRPCENRASTWPRPAASGVEHCAP